jgi:hypothetical protein
MMNRLHPSHRFAGLALMLGLLTLANPAAAEDIRRFVIPAHDGYDLEACMTTSNSCAQIVANAWCDAKGYNQAIAFEPVPAGDITATLATTTLRSSPRNGVLITCSK